jgi:aminoglycoside phosphotransferase (APT) family kinase protein
MHADELPIDATLVRRLLAAQFPQWAALPLSPVKSAGTDNALFRLGDDLVVRLPRIHWAADKPEREHRWLPQLAPHLPLPISTPVALGMPGEGYPCHWTVCNWIEGENALLGHMVDARHFAAALAGFVRALQRIDAAGGPVADRGVPLAQRDAYTRDALAQCEGLIDVAAATRAWQAARATPAWRGPAVWLHGDLQSGNLLQKNGALCAVIDFGCMTVGDPACDLMIAWNLFDADTRATFRNAVNVDEATWARGRGWALSVVVALPYYQHSNPTLAGISRHAIAQVLAESV